MKHTAPPVGRHKRTLLASGALGLTAALLSTVAVSAAAVPVAVDGQNVETAPAAAVASSSVTAREPEELLVEDFENGGGTVSELVSSYVGVAGATYTADPAWISAPDCNGILTSYDSSVLPGCSSAAGNHLRNMANVLGQITGSEPRANHIVSAYTNASNPGAGKVQLESVQPFALSDTGRFVSFGVSAAAMNCTRNHPLLDFSLVDGTVEHKIADTPIDPCSDPGTQNYTVDGSAVTGGTFVSKGGLLFSGDSLRWVMRNQQASGVGNDGAIDHVSVVDSTPTLVQEITGTPIVADTARMTYRVVNTTEHGAKEGWSFDANLPEGLTVAVDPRTETTCTSPEITAASGATSVAVRGGIAAGDADCTVSVDVTTTTPGTYSVAPTNVTTTVGLDVAGSSSVEFAAERNALTISGAPLITGGNGDGVADLGEQIAFRYQVANAGNVPVHDVRLDDRGSCDVSELAVEASTECTTTARAVTQDDVDAGSIDHQVDVAARSRLDAAVSGSATSAVPTTEQSAGSGLAVAPVVQTKAEPGVGGKVSLGISVSNTGNVTLQGTEVVVDGDTGMNVTCGEGGITPGDSIECDVAGSATVTQADVDHGSISFSATATSHGPKGQTVTATGTTSQATVSQAPAVQVALAGELSGTGSPRAGDTVSFEGSVENSGNVTLHDFIVTVPGFDMAVEAPSGALVPGAKATVTVADYALTQADVDSGTVSVPLHVTATGPKEQRVEDDARSAVEIEQHTAMSVEFGAALDASGTPKAGDSVSLSGELTNTGNVTLDGLAVSIVDRDDISVEVPAVPIAPGAVVSATIASATLTQDDIDAGVVSFRMRGGAVGPQGQIANGEAGTSIDLEQAAGAGLSLAPVVHAAADPGVDDEISLRITASNTGNTTLRDTRVEVAGASGMTVDCPATIAPGKSVDCEVDGSHTVTQADVDRGAVAFTATATSAAANGAAVEVEAKTTQATVAQVASVTAEFSGRLSEKGAPSAGDEISFTGSVENVGNVTLHEVAVDLPGFDLEVGVPSKPLAPGKSISISVSDYTLTQRDIDSGVVTVPLRTRATGPKGQPASADESADVTLERHPLVESVLSAHLADTDHGGEPRAGDAVALAATLRNTGNVTLSDVTADIGRGVPKQVVDGTLAPGTDVVVELAAHVLTQQDIDRGSVGFDLAAAGAGPTGEQVSSADHRDVSLQSAAGIDLEGAYTSSASTESLRSGDVVTGEFTIANTGNRTVHHAAVEQQHGAAASCESSELMPGQVVSCETEYTVTDSDAAAGSVTFSAKAKAQYTVPEGADAAVTTRAAVERQNVWVFSKQITEKFAASSAPQELAFTGTGVVLVGLPIAIVVLVLGAVLLLTQRRRRQAECGPRS
ncbi:hypothetical protein [Curtobacterium sp. VKM Ac-2884]|uniref:DUF7507 domain-containing protein n=1 Tax=Curtobacterium sp. VKM Ac-2884 TaxID=2783818 RepID=UPI00188BECA3|nr:hypothetical protein [Curtobacterium sp. VKM Ac-2884]MBF4602897.1 hypothetical protein [Curtobacterium sp. VKM Ac-2884]